MLDADWLLYQDDNEGETLHLRHLPSGEDALVCESVTYQSFLSGGDLYAILMDGDDQLLARIALNTPEIRYDEAAGAFSYSFAREESDKRVNSSVAVSSNGWIYIGTENGCALENWKSAENADGDRTMDFVFSDEQYEVYWKIEEGLITGVYVGCLDGGAQPIGYFD